jgi:hypothetical protein
MDVALAYVCLVIPARAYGNVRFPGMARRGRLPVILDSSDAGVFSV